MSRSQAGGVAGLKLLDVIRDFLAQLDEIQTLPSRVFVSNFQNEFGEISFPPQLRPDDKANLKWLRSMAGQAELARLVELKLVQMSQKGESFDKLDAYTVNMITTRRLSTAIQKRQGDEAAAKAAQEALMQPRCPSGSHGVGEGPCAYVGGGRWGS